MRISFLTFGIALLAAVGVAEAQSQGVRSSGTTTPTSGISSPTALTPMTATNTYGTTSGSGSAGGSTGASSSLFKSGGNAPQVGNNTGSGNRAMTGRSSTGKTPTNPNDPNAQQQQKHGETPNPSQDEDWFIQRSHERGSFVGADSSDALGFVGMSQAMGQGQIKSSITSLRALRMAASIYSALPAKSKTAMYDPRITVAPEDLPRIWQPGVADARVATRLEASPSLQRFGQIGVSMQGTTATLRGVVASERDRAMAEQMAKFEPGVDEVKNELKVQPAGSQPASNGRPEDVKLAPPR